MTRFDEDTALTPAGDGTFGASITGRWNTLMGVNGGYMLALCTRALGEVLPFPDPLVVSGFFLRPGSVGPASVTTSIVRSGRTTAVGEASLWREGKELLRATAAFTDLAAAAANAQPPAIPPVHVPGPPDLPPPAASSGLPGGSFPGVSLSEQVEYRAGQLPGWLDGKPSGDATSECWMRFKDDRPPDVLALPLLVDAAPPPALEIGVASTTVELTVHLRARPAPGWLACRSRTRHLGGGYHEEDFEIWDSSGVLVAQSRQLAMVLK